MYHLNKFLEKSRKEKGLSQDNVGQLLGFNNGQYISNIERRECSLSPKYFKRIARLYGIGLDDLIQAAMEDVLEKLEKEIKAG